MSLKAQRVIGKHIYNLFDSYVSWNECKQGRSKHLSSRTTVLKGQSEGTSAEDRKEPFMKAGVPENNWMTCFQEGRDWLH